MSSLDGQHNRDVWWRSLDELADAPRFRAFLEAEFPAEADPGGINRRRWLQLMGASLALAAAGGCRWKKQEILPFAERPEGRTPGKTERFATAMPLGDTVMGLEVTCVDGRPIKIDGNPRHPQSLGATDVFAQAALLELYDPDRSRSVTLQNGERRPREDLGAVCRSVPSRSFGGCTRPAGAGFRVLAEASSSPTLAALRSRLLEGVSARRNGSSTSRPATTTQRAGAVLAFGRPLRTHLRLDRAEVIVCLDADPLGSHPAAVRYARDFAAGRQPESGRMSRLYVVESGVSLTGAAADHRLPLRPSADSRRSWRQLERRTGVRTRRRRPKPMQPFMRAVVGDLLAPENRGRSVVCAGPSQPPEVHAAVHRINALLGNVGEEETIAYTRTSDPERPSHVEAIRTLVDEMNAGEVDTLLILGGNPVYNAPADLAFGEALKRVETTIHLSGYRDETSRRCTWHLPRAHFLEAWGDGRSYDGTYSVIQPMIAPLRNGRSPIEVLSMILSSETGKDAMPTPEELVRKTFREQIAGDSGASWRQVLRDGLAGREPVAGRDGLGGRQAAVAIWKRRRRSSPTTGSSKSIFRRDRSVYDGRFANNSWLQELPDPVTKLTWGDAALIGPATAEKLGIENEDAGGPEAGRSAGAHSGLRPAGPGPGNRRAAAGLRPLGRGQGRRRCARGGAGRRGRVSRCERRRPCTWPAARRSSRPAKRIVWPARKTITPSTPWAARRRKSEPQRSSARRRLEHYREASRLRPARRRASAAEIALAGARVRGTSLGHVDRPVEVHRLRGVRRGLSGREQHSGGGPRAGAQGPGDALAARGPLLPRRAGQSRGGLSAVALSAMRIGPVRAGVSRWPRRFTATRGSTTWSTTGASASAIAPTTVPTRCGVSTSSIITRSSRTRRTKSPR